MMLAKVGKMALVRRGRTFFRNPFLLGRRSIQTHSQLGTEPPPTTALEDYLAATGGLTLLLGFNGLAIWAMTRDNDTMLHNIATAKKSHDAINEKKKKKKNNRKYKTSIHFRFTR